MNNRPDAAAIRAAQTNNSKMRARDLAAQIGISEAELVAASAGMTARRIAVDFDQIFTGLAGVGEVMALTRNESAVHEKIGVYDKYTAGKHAAMMGGEQIDMRMFPTRWAYGFASTDKSDDGTRRSLQFFDIHGNAVHKVHARPATNLKKWDGLVDLLTLGDQSPDIIIDPVVATPEAANEFDRTELRERWARMTDIHQFFGILKKLKLERVEAVRAVGEDFAWQIDKGSIAEMLNSSAEEKLPIMCFVGNDGCIQIHSGPVANIKIMGPWLNIMDSDFHLHLRCDHIKEAWAVRKPTDKGHVTSLEAYGADGQLIIQFFGKRAEGHDERMGWRTIMENLPRSGEQRAA